MLKELRLISSKCKIHFTETAVKCSNSVHIAKHYRANSFRPLGARACSTSTVGSGPRCEQGKESQWRKQVTHAVAGKIEQMMRWLTQAVNQAAPRPLVTRPGPGSTTMLFILTVITSFLDISCISFIKKTYLTLIGFIDNYFCNSHNFDWNRSSDRSMATMIGAKRSTNKRTKDSGYWSPRWAKRARRQSGHAGDGRFRSACQRRDR